MPITPLYENLRPKSLDDIVGQEHLTKEGKILQSFISNGKLPSIILYGPPGTGKTTLAKIMAKKIDAKFYQLSATSAGVKEIRKIADEAKGTDLFSSDRNILFIDEIHDLNKSQQDTLLENVELGVFTLIGATTENPSYELNHALLSRCHVLTLRSLNSDAIKKLVNKAIQALRTDGKEISVIEWEELLSHASGDGRKAIGLMELISSASNQNRIELTNDYIKKIAISKITGHDKSGDQHYDTISALIKSMRASNGNAAVYYLGRLIKGGENPKFIARRLVIFASEDIGLADSQALTLAMSAMHSIMNIGMPEGRIMLSHAVLYLSNAPKSRVAYNSIGKVLSHLDGSSHLPPIPFGLTNKPVDYNTDSKQEGSFLPIGVNDSFVENN